LEIVKWPGRLEWCHIPTLDRTILLDGAHNEQAAIELSKYVETIRKERSSRKIVWITGFKKDKNAISILKHIVQTNDSLKFLSFSTPEGMPWVISQEPAFLNDKYMESRPGFRGDVIDLEEFANLLMRDMDSVYVVCGSLYLIADVYRFFNING
jgi:folylpolyglutamate synthase